MIYEKTLKILWEEGEEERTYYVRIKYSECFKRKMYNVGIKVRNELKEIEDFSPDEAEAIGLCDFLYKESVSSERLFGVAEEFISGSYI